MLPRRAAACVGALWRSARKARSRNAHGYTTGAQGAAGGGLVVAEPGVEVVPRGVDCVRPPVCGRGLEAPMGGASRVYQGRASATQGHAHRGYAAQSLWAERVDSWHSFTGHARACQRAPVVLTSAAPAALLPRGAAGLVAGFRHMSTAESGARPPDEKPTEKLGEEAEAGETEASGEKVVRKLPLVRATELQEVVIVGAARTAVGSYQGSLASFSAPHLGGAAIAGALAKAGVAASEVQEVIMGNVVSAGLGQAPAKQAAMSAGVPASAVCTTVNKVCSSGLKAVMLGAQSIAQGAHSVVVAGGMESMSQAPFLLRRSANLRRHGDLPLLDAMLCDGLTDPQRGHPMGVMAQHCADELRIQREEQDEEAILSYQKALAAEATGKFRHEIVSPLAPFPVLGPGHKAAHPGHHGPPMFDEGLKKFDPDKLRQLSSAFLPGGSITAGNASALADGAAALVLTSASYADRHGLTVLARIAGWADAEQDPERFPTSPSLAIPLALKAARLQLRDTELFEINEAFAAVTLATASLLGLPREQINVHGGAVALGHPIGASGARILVSLLTSLGCQQEDIGVAAVCNGGGGASALVVERGPSFVIPDHHGLNSKEQQVVEGA